MLFHECIMIKITRLGYTILFRAIKKSAALVLWCFILPLLTAQKGWDILLPQNYCGISTWCGFKKTDFFFEFFTTPVPDTELCHILMMMPCLKTRQLIQCVLLFFWTESVLGVDSATSCTWSRFQGSYAESCMAGVAAGEAATDDGCISRRRESKFLLTHLILLVYIYQRGQISG